MRKKVKLLAASGEETARPPSAASQETATISSSIRPAVASHASSEASECRPIGTATAKTRAAEIRLRTVLALTWPATKASPLISRARKRSMMPWVMSPLTLTAVVEAPSMTTVSTVPGVR